MTLNKKITLSASGKINLYLNVKKNGRVDGYHEIKSIMQSISLSDELNFEISHKSRSLNQNPRHNANEDNNIVSNGISITTNTIDIPLGEKNLVHKAALLILKKFDLEKKYNIKININKSIPVGAGLAGGSTNAAATLIALDKIFNLDISMDKLLELGNEVGSDVPFCISGGTALVEGKGEKISKLPDLPFYWVVLSSNGEKFLSADVYNKFDLIGKERDSVHDRLVSNLLDRNFTDFFAGLDNDLERVVTIEDRMVASIKEKAISLGAFAAMMTGSGPTVFAFCSDLKAAKRVYKGLEELSNKVFLTYTTPDSLNFI
jgi:4-diphosphocytidyl-2-C-methyl-D-erythritol kinase